MRIVSWNIAHREAGWRELAESDYDLALLQEASPPPAGLPERLRVDGAPWSTAGTTKRRGWRAAIVALSDRVEVDWIGAASLADAQAGELAVSRLGTLAAAIIRSDSMEPILAFSMYGAWENPHPSTGGGWIYADASVHRLISDISSFIGQRTTQHVIAAGDLNILMGYGEHGNKYWGARYATIFDRMAAIGLSFVGPQAPGGRAAEPWPKELPIGSRNVPTYHTTRQTPASATRQLDFVFATKSLDGCLDIRARNAPCDWGPSDHCRVEIELSGRAPRT